MATKPKIAFQGEHGAFSELAAFEHFGGEINTLPCESFEAAFAAFEQGQCSHVLLPFENSLAGSIHRNYDLILRHDVQIVSEYNLRVNHCLMGLAHAELSQITFCKNFPLLMVCSL